VVLMPLGAARSVFRLEKYALEDLCSVEARGRVKGWKNERSAKEFAEIAMQMLFDVSNVVLCFDPIRSFVILM